MRLKFFTVPVFGPGDSETELNRFLAQHRILKVDRGLVTESSGACWAVCVGYLDSEMKPASRKRSRIDYREVLSPTEFEIYADLRRWRKVQAADDGVPPYQIFTNEQLAAIVQQGVRTVESLTLLPGVGPARLAKYGQSVLDQFSSLTAALEESLEGHDETEADSA